MEQIESQDRQYFISQMQSWSKEIILALHKTDMFIEVLDYVGANAEYKESVKRVNKDMENVLEKVTAIVEDMAENYDIPLS